MLLDEAIDALQINSEGIYVDCTLGRGGHSAAILRQLSKCGRLIGFDQDLTAIKAVQTRLGQDDRLTLIHDNFEHLQEQLAAQGIATVDGILFDLGVSSPQFDDHSRGFSYHGNERLDMRMDQRSALTAYDIVNTYSQEELQKILYVYGEERWAKRIVSNICKARTVQPITTTGELVDLIRPAIPAKERSKHHPARKTFQALRIAVNRELDVLERALHQAVECLHPGGRVVVISFHSLEDRVVKHIFKTYQKGCTCPPELPVCVCGKVPLLKLTGKQPIYPNKNEIEENARARSARMRWAIKR